MNRLRYIHLSAYHIGVGVGLVSISFFFGALILAFGFRIGGQQEWRPVTPPGLLWVSTIALLGSSLAFEAARHSLRRGFVVMYRGRLAGTLALAGLFGLAQLGSAWQLLQQGIVLEANPQGSAFYIFMGLHGAHVLGGLIWIVVLHRISRQLFTATETGLRKHRTLAGAAAIYWHFMALLWLLLFWFLLLWSRAPVSVYSQ